MMTMYHHLADDWYFARCSVCVCAFCIFINTFQLIALHQRYLPMPFHTSACEGTHDIQNRASSAYMNSGNIMPLETQMLRSTNHPWISAAFVIMQRIIHTWLRTETKHCTVWTTFLVVGMQMPTEGLTVHLMWKVIIKSQWGRDWECFLIRQIKCQNWVCRPLHTARFTRLLVCLLACLPACSLVCGACSKRIRFLGKKDLNILWRVSFVHVHVCICIKCRTRRACHRDLRRRNSNTVKQRKQHIYTYSSYVAVVPGLDNLFVPIFVVVVLCLILAVVDADVGHC